MRKAMIAALVGAGAFGGWAMAGTEAEDVTTMEESKVEWALVSGDGESLLITSGTHEWFTRDGKNVFFAGPEYRPVLFATKAEAEAHIAAKGYNEYTRAERWQR